ncbi:ESX-3 secretion-associated protein EspG3 [Mycolicibacterium litorale]|uniref:ESX-3 secretion-associated protein EspG3 n=1 Tax=Mycolicibacterium litorale TaxID=758802 RepID=A0A6S6NZA3_9MYCO|nr:ESX secretion-associated protein EspG [Mycolicibacterium litorale]BCI51162.1 ESX-3 secretion-associated protein EspG3 [Mycolicibacterium litorale]
MGPNAVELTAAQAWFVADIIGAGSLPWVLAVTPPYSHEAERAGFTAETVAALESLGVLSGDDGRVDPRVAEWVRVVCRAEQWLDLRFVSGRGALLRGVVARRRGQTVVALRSGALVTFTRMDIDHPHALVPVLCAGLSQRPPARFAEFTLPTDVGARADERIRQGAPLAEVLDFLGIPPSARPVVEAAFDTTRTYVEIVAGEHRDGHRVSTQVGVSVVDTAEGRVLVSPARAFDGEWVSTFAPGTPFAIAAAVERLTGSLPSGAWFPDLHLTRDFDEHDTREPRTRQCPTTL